MKTRKSYWRRWLRWSYEATRSQPPWWSFLTWLVTILVTIIIRGIPDSFFEIPASVQDLDASDIVRVVASFPTAIVVLWLINLVRAPGKIDGRLRDEFEEAIQRVKDNARNLDRNSQIEMESLIGENERLNQRVGCFEKRLRPNIWITGKSYANALVTRECRGEMGVGFIVDNKSGKALHDVRVELVKIEEGFLTREACIDFANEDGCGRLEDRATYVDRKDLGKDGINLPIMLEWNPQQQHSQGVSSTTIPAGTERLIGLFSSQTILAADYDMRGYLGVSSGVVYKIAIRLSARDIPAITSQEYVISRINKSEFLVSERNIRYEVYPGGAFELVSPRDEIEF